jgi:hypothetical protein
VWIVESHEAQAFRDQARLDALAMVLNRNSSTESWDQILAEASRAWAWLIRMRLIITAAPLTYEQGSPARSVSTKIDGGIVQLTDTQQVTLSVAAEDSKGFAVSDTLTWSSADDTIVSLQPAADGMSCLCVAGNPGTGNVVTVTDGTLTATESFDVVPSGVATLTITPGTPEDQPAAPAAPSGTGA